MQIGNDVFGSSKPILSIDTDSYVIIPNTVSFQDLDSEIDYSQSNENRVAGIEYSYHGMYVGNAYLNLVTDNASSYEFDTNMTATDVSVEKTEAESETDVESQDTIFINIKKVLVIILVAAAAVITIFMIQALITNRRTAKRRNNRIKRKQRRRSRMRADFDDFDF